MGNEQNYHLLQISSNDSDNDYDEDHNNDDDDNVAILNVSRYKLDSDKGCNEFLIWRVRYKVAAFVIISVLLYLNVTVKEWRPISIKYDTNNNEEVVTYTTPFENVTIVNLEYLKEHNNEKLEALKPPLGYLVWSDKCKIPNIDPYEPEIMKLFKRQKFEPCTSTQPLTTVQFNETTKQYRIVFDSNLLKQFVHLGKINCSYQAIIRKPNTDSSISLSKRVSFEVDNELPIDIDNIIVECENSKLKKKYVNGHPLIAEHPEIRQRLINAKSKHNQNSTKMLNVLMVGIDSISRTNLRRAMTKTAQYLYDNSWFEMSGYNKMGDNTFPNLMAVLTGYNLTRAYDVCKPKTSDGMDNCPMVWKQYQDFGYVTSYAEDETEMSTFNYLKKGFSKPPVDYYLRPFLLQAEKSLPIKKKSGLKFCLGYKHTADYIYDYGVDLAKRYTNDPYFGFFWANSFSHNDVSDPTTMDEKMVKYLQTFGKENLYEKSIVIFFSDHGMRFGATRKYLSGQLEERLPFLFISLPKWFQKDYPQYVKSLIINENRLTNPYDLHMTLQHILQLSGKNFTLQPAEGCPNCQSLFETVPPNRSCEDIGINDHWCTCIPYQAYKTDSSHIKNITHMIIDQLNDMIHNYKNGSFIQLCQRHTFKSIQSAYLSVSPLSDGNGNTNGYDNYKIVFTTKPSSAEFEATVRYFSAKKTIEIMGSISRLNSYADDSKCVTESFLQKYCSCFKKKRKG